MRSELRKALCLELELKAGRAPRGLPGFPARGQDPHLVSRVCLYYAKCLSLNHSLLPCLNQCEHPGVPFHSFLPPSIRVKCKAINWVTPFPVSKQLQEIQRPHMTTFTVTAISTHLLVNYTLQRDCHLSHYETAEFSQADGILLSPFYFQ